MQDMVLNHPSIEIRDEITQIACLQDLAKGIATLQSANIANKNLRMTHHLYEIPLSPAGSIYDALNKMRKGNAREEAAFWMSLAQKCPLLEDVPEADVDEIQGKEIEAMPTSGPILLLCAQKAYISISFPTGHWDRDQIEFEYQELDDQGETSLRTASIDNLARSSHANAIIARYRSDLFSNLTLDNFWAHRHTVFKNLDFGLNVEQQLSKLGEGLFPQIVEKLRQLQASAATWGNTQDVRWHCKVTDESDSVKNDSRLAAQRRFADANGKPQDFFWHARVGSSVRIHFRFDVARKWIEIGYIGPHLPL